MCIKGGGGNCYRVLLGKNEWFQSRKDCLRCTLCFLDFLLYLSYLLSLLCTIGFLYFACVGLGYPLMLIIIQEPEYNKSPRFIWGVGFCIGFFFLGLIVMLAFIFWKTCPSILGYISSEEYIRPLPEEKEQEIALTSVTAEI